MISAEEVKRRLLLEFANGFKITEHTLPSGVQVTTDRNVALWLCGLKVTPKGKARYGEIWTDTLETVSGRLQFRLNKSGNAVMASAEKCGEELADFWIEQLDEIGMDDFMDTIWAYSTIMVCHRALEDGSDSLGEWFIRILRAGGLPCGCEGKWPDAPLVVYWPHKTPPKFE